MPSPSDSGVRLLPRAPQTHFQSPSCLSMLLRMTPGSNYQGRQRQAVAPLSIFFFDSAIGERNAGDAQTQGSRKMFPQKIGPRENFLACRLRAERRLVRRLG